MRILLFGASGQVGFECRRTLAPVGTVVVPDRATVDLERPATVREAIAAVRPDVIVNAAAYTAVDKAETEPERAQAINAAAVGAMAEEMARLGGWLLHYSTDYVFDGTKAGPYVETDPPAPLGVYGRTKLEGERLVAASGCRSLVFRTSWVFADRGHNFLRTILRLAADRDALDVVADQVGSPTSAGLLADVAAAAVRRLAAGSPPPCGVYHACPRGETSWHGYAAFIVAEARGRGLPVRVAADAIRPIPAAAYPTPVRRPANSRLDTSALRAAFGIELPPWQRDVAAAVAAIAAAAAGPRAEPTPRSGGTDGK